MTPSTDPDQAEAQRRVDEACSLIARAYRLYTLHPPSTLAAVRAAIVNGAEAQAADVAEQVYRG